MKRNRVRWVNFWKWSLTCALLLQLALLRFGISVELVNFFEGAHIGNFVDDASISLALAVLLVWVQR